MALFCGDTVLEGVELVEGVDVEDAVGGDRGRGDVVGELDGGEQFFFLGGGEDTEILLEGAGIDLPVRDKGRPPGLAADVVGPIGLAGVRVDAVEDAVGIGDEHKAVVFTQWELMQREASAALDSRRGRHAFLLNSDATVHPGAIAKMLEFATCL